MATQQVLQEAFEKAKTLANDTEGWKEEKRDNVAVLTSKNFPECPINCFRVAGTVNASPEKAAELLWNWRKPEWQKFATDVEGKCVFSH